MIESIDMIRVRIAPSPTGFAHVGTAYSALFNYAFAKKNNGKFILRLEDTDIKRNVLGAEQAIYEGLLWLGLLWDEGPDKGGKYAPYRQSERLDIYKEAAERLIKRKLAYKKEGAVKFKNPSKSISWKDLIHGEISFPEKEVKDFVILKSDGFPTYNFGNVVDDISMKISHVIRGEEHISNTSRQIALYRALGANPPEFAHLPTLRNKDRKKLSKRRDTVDLRIFREQGYLPEAMINFLCLLGWSHPKGKEIFDIREFVKFFTLERVRKSGPIFDIAKLDWINGEYIRRLKIDVFNQKLFEFFGGKYSKDFIVKISPLLQTRIKKLKDFEIMTGFFFETPKVDKSILGKNYLKHLTYAYEALSKIADWKVETINEVLLNLIKREKFETGDFFMDLRIALTGSKITPPINESIVLLGKSNTLKRIKSLIS